MYNDLGDMMLQVDSRKVKKGDTFIALRGVDTDGHDYILKAISNGASKVICEEGSYDVETIVVSDTRKYLANYLKDEFANLRDKVKIIGITGTNGKTTTAFLLHEAFYLLGVKAAYIGTIGFYMHDKIRSLNNTTPDLFDLYNLFKEAISNGAKAIVLEVSSQGISYGRVLGIDFDMAIFTNLTPDHLDYHKTMENYALAKQELFRHVKNCAIVNIDDSYKDYYLLDNNKNITYGFSNSDYQIKNYKMNHQGSIFTYSNPLKQEYVIKTPLIGKYNLYNLMGVVISLKEYGFKEEQIIKVLETLKAPSGRMDIIPYHDNSIIIDYAHTPDALEKILKTVKEVTKGNIITVFGCTGSRDRGKRPMMMRLATELSDYVIVTSDDLHNEAFEDIVDDMLKDNKQVNYEVIQDRFKAIEKGISYLKDNDVLLILGKGHEEFIIVKDQKIPFNDREVVLDIIKVHVN